MCLLVHHFYSSPCPTPALPALNYVPQVSSPNPGLLPSSIFLKAFWARRSFFLWSFVINSRLISFLPLLCLGKVQSCGFYTLPVCSSFCWRQQSFETVAAIAEWTALLVPQVASAIHRVMSAKPRLLALPISHNFWGHFFVSCWCLWGFGFFLRVGWSI